MKKTKRQAMRDRIRGVTLIELMVALAVVAILVAIAYPSYQQHVQRSRRAMAAACLQEIALQMERRYTTSMKYNSATGLPATGCIAELANFYTFAFSSNEPTASTFRVAAAPTAAQNDATCGTLSLNHQGVKAALGTDTSASLVANCWR